MISEEVATRYIVEDELGRGGTALVYRARDLDRGGQVAIKILREDILGDISVERFLREVRLTAQLPHPHILPVLDSGEHAGRPFCVLPYMDGGTLRQKLDRQKQLPLREVIELGATIARALDFAHRRGLLHRDVKPENILYSGDTPCLADFGIARALDRAIPEASTSTGIVRGTPAYMSPEQVSGDRDYDGRTDIYSLACVLYEAIAGVQAFLGPTSQVIIAQRLVHLPRSVRVFRPTVPPELDAVLEKAVALSPADRYATAGEFADALEGTLPALDRPLTESHSIGAVAPPKGRRRLAIFTISALIIAAVGFLMDGMVTGSRAVPLDTTRVVILPFQQGGLQSVEGADLLYEGMRRWRGLSVVETFSVVDAVRQRGGVTSEEDARAVATSLGAGRFIRGRLVDLGSRSRIDATLYDAKVGRLYGASIDLPSSPAARLAQYQALADSLVLRGATGTAPAEGSTVSLSGTQAFLKARAALDEWDLSAADSLFASAASMDSSNTRASLWLAQVRSWQGRPVSEWTVQAGRAAVDSIGLSSAERRQARALSAMATGHFPQACGEYDLITKAAPNEFLGWYGAGECHRRDHLVVPDSTSPSKWRFRSSYERAIVNYKKAFELLPSSYRGVQSSAYQPLRGLFYTSSTRLMSGHRDRSLPEYHSATYACFAGGNEHSRPRRLRNARSRRHTILDAVGTSSRRPCRGPTGTAKRAVGRASCSDRGKGRSRCQEPGHRFSSRAGVCIGPGIRHDTGRNPGAIRLREVAQRQ